MPALFISYRRSDSSDITGRIFDRLVGHFGNKPVKVVRDVDSIPVGEDFREVLRDRIQDCDVVLVIIGPNWTTVTDNKGTRRLEDAADTVRIEIEQALELKKKVIPVCVTHAQMPTEEDLPETIKKLAFRNGVQVRPDPDFNNDISRLISALDKIFKDKQIAEAKPPTLPPPQRHFHPPEPPPPPLVDTRRSSGSHGASAGIVTGGSPFGSNPLDPPVSAQAVDKAAGVPERSGDSSPGTRPGSTNTPANLQRPAAPPSTSPFSQPTIPPQPTRQPAVTRNLLSSFMGVAMLLTGLVSLCMCGGLFVYFCISMAGQSYQRDLRTDLQNKPEIIEHLGEIISVEWDYGATGLPKGPNGEYSDLFKVKGTKGSGEVIGHSQGGTMVGDTLRLPDGKNIPLRESFFEKALVPDP